MWVFENDQHWLSEMIRFNLFWMTGFLILWASLKLLRVKSKRLVYDPVIWVFDRAIERYREMACDSEVLALKNSQKRKYAAALLSIAVLTKSSRDNTMPAVLFFRRNSLMRTCWVKTFIYAKKRFSNLGTGVRWSRIQKCFIVSKKMDSHLKCNRA